MRKVLPSVSEDELDFLRTDPEEENPYEGDDSERIRLKPSEFTEFAMFMPSGGEYRKFSFNGRKYLRQIYDTPAKRRILMAGRQVEKSTLLGNQTLAYSALNIGFKSLYVSPSNTQTKVFSRDRIKEPLETSPVLKNFTNSRLLANVLEKKFINRSQITLRFAFLNADRCRGIPADFILIDEFQDILLDNIPVIEECASHSEHKLFCYSGTPKSYDNAIEYYYQRFSTQNEWVVPCHRHGTPNNPGSWHWNVLTEDHIGPQGLICDRCGNRIYAEDEHAQWAALNPKPNCEKPFEGYRLPQLMVPWLDWDDLLHKQRVYSRAKFHNEVLGRSFDSGTRPLTQNDVRENCSPKLSLKHYPEIAKKWSGSVPMFMGIDWGTGEGTFSVMTLGAYLPFAPDIFTYFYWRRFEGPESEPKRQLEIIFDFADMFKVAYIGTDYGGGHWPNDELVRKYGAEKIKKYQWLGNPKKKLAFEGRLGVPRFLAHRTEVFSDLFNAIKRGNVFQYPRWEEFEHPYAQDHLNIFSEYNDRTRMNVYKHAPGMPDDSFQAATFCFLASFFYRKRPDVVLPKKELDYVQEHNERDEYDIHF
jgi:hypothetical protein